MADKPIDHTTEEREFVRAISGQYNLNEELNRLRELPRVRRGNEIPFKGYPSVTNKNYLIPSMGLGQTLHIHLEDYAPGAMSQKHGHVNEAVFYILDGEGAEIHDGVRHEWEAGDVAIVHNNCVHQHFNRSTEKPSRCLVMKTKPMYMFMNMLFQKTVTKFSTEPTPTQGDWKPRIDPDPHELDHELDDHQNLQFESLNGAKNGSK